MAAAVTDTEVAVLVARYLEAAFPRTAAAFAKEARQLLAPAAGGLGGRVRALPDLISEFCALKEREAARRAAAAAGPLVADLLAVLDRHAGLPSLAQPTNASAAAAAAAAPGPVRHTRAPSGHASLGAAVVGAHSEGRPGGIAPPAAGASAEQLADGAGARAGGAGGAGRHMRKGAPRRKRPEDAGDIFSPPAKQRRCDGGVGSWQMLQLPLNEAAVQQRLLHDEEFQGRFAASLAQHINNDDEVLMSLDELLEAIPEDPQMMELLNPLVVPAAPGVAHPAPPLPHPAVPPAPHSAVQQAGKRSAQHTTTTASPVHDPPPAGALTQAAQLGQPRLSQVSAGGGGSPPTARRLQGSLDAQAGDLDAQRAPDAGLPPQRQTAAGLPEGAAPTAAGAGQAHAVGGLLGTCVELSASGRAAGGTDSEMAGGSADALGALAMLTDADALDSFLNQLHYGDSAPDQSEVPREDSPGGRRSEALRRQLELSLS